MKLVVENLGQIEHAELELAPLTIFLGKNGTQKTWTGHSYFKLLETYRVADTVPSSALVPRDIEALVEDVAREWSTKLAADSASEVSLTQRREELLDRLPEVISTALSTPDQFRSALGIAPRYGALVRLDIPKPEFRAGVLETLNITVSSHHRRIDRTHTFRDGKAPWRRTEFANNDDDVLESIRGALRDLAMGWRYHVRALPAERVHLVQAFSWLLREKSLSMPRALVDFCYLMAIGAASRVASPDGSLREAYTRAAGGQVSFSRDGEILFRSADQASGELPIKAAASLAKSMAGLSVFLGNAQSGDAIIIDEPEMNAHPDAQIALVELFAAMVRVGMHVVLITQSPYVVNHISVLLEEAHVPRDQLAAIRERNNLSPGEIALTGEQLAVYEFQGKTVRSVFDRASGSIDWSTFTDVNDRESRLMGELVEHEDDAS